MQLGSYPVTGIIPLIGTPAAQRRKNKRQRQYRRQDIQ